MAIKKPVGILHVKVVRASKLLKKDFLGTSDPYVKLSLTGEKLPWKKTTVKKKNLNPEWNENFKLVVKEPESQILQLQVFDWDKVFILSKLLPCGHFLVFIMNKLKLSYTDENLFLFLVLFSGSIIHRLEDMTGWECSWFPWNFSHPMRQRNLLLICSSTQILMTLKTWNKEEK